MSSIRTKFAHKSIMLGILFLGVLLNSQLESWNSTDVVADQAEVPAIDSETEQSTDSLEAQYEEEETNIAGLG